MIESWSLTQLSLMDYNYPSCIQTFPSFLHVLDHQIKILNIDTRFDRVFYQKNHKILSNRYSANYSSPQNNNFTLCLRGIIHAGDSMDTFKSQFPLHLYLPLHYFLAVSCSSFRTTARDLFPSALFPLAVKGYY